MSVYRMRGPDKLCATPGALGRDAVCAGAFPALPVRVELMPVVRLSVEDHESVLFTTDDLKFDTRATSPNRDLLMEEAWNEKLVKLFSGMGAIPARAPGTTRLRGVKFTTDLVER